MGTHGWAVGQAPTPCPLHAPKAWSSLDVRLAGRLSDRGLWPPLENPHRVVSTRWWLMELYMGYEKPVFLTLNLGEPVHTTHHHQPIQLL